MKKVPVWFNPEEVDAVCTTVRQLLDSEEINVSTDDIAVMTPFMSQAVSYTHLTLPTICSV